MSYTKQTWQAGDEITSAKLNHLEDGINNVATEIANFPVEVNNPQDGDTLIYNAAEQKWVSGSSNGGSGGGCLILHIDGNNTLDKTWKEIKDAVSQMPVVYYYETNDDGAMQYQVDFVTNVVYLKNEGKYEIYTSNYFFVTDSENGYPVMQQNVQ